MEAIMPFESHDQAVDAVGRAHHSVMFMRNRCLIAMRALDANIDSVSEEACQTRHGILSMLEQLHEELDELTTLLDRTNTTLGQEQHPQIAQEARS